jgi:sec-independent protein translocase protein TatA
MLAFIRNIGGPEVLIILVVVLLLFGAAKLPQLARSLGASAKEFRKGVEEGVEDDESSATNPPPD